MIIYLDESGDLGFDFSNSKTSHYLIVTLLVCDTPQIAKKVNSAIRRTIKNKLPNKLQELKGSNTSTSVKNYFLLHINGVPGWKIYAIAVDKSSWLKSSQCVIDKNYFYDWVAHKLLLQVDFSNVVSNMSLIVDRSKSNQSKIARFNQMIRKSLISMLPPKTIFSIEHKASHQEFGLQAVDLFCWGISRKYHYNDTEWYSKFKEKIIVELIYKFEA